MDGNGRLGDIVCHNKRCNCHKPDKAKGWGLQERGNCYCTSTACTEDHEAYSKEQVERIVRQTIEEAVKERDEYWHDVLREQREASEDRS
jgi:hypothetical protein